MVSKMMRKWVYELIVTHAEAEYKMREMEVL